MFVDCGHTDDRERVATRAVLVARGDAVERHFVTLVQNRLMPKLPSSACTSREQQAVRVSADLRLQRRTARRGE